jgi:hypothetical protein
MTVGTAAATDLLAWNVDQATENFGLFAELHDRTNADYRGAVPMVGFGAGAYVLAMLGRDTPEPAACGSFAPEPGNDADGGVDGGGAVDAGTYADAGHPPIDDGGVVPPEAGRGDAGPSRDGAPPADVSSDASDAPDPIDAGSSDGEPDAEVDGGGGGSTQDSGTTGEGGARPPNQGDSSSGCSSVPRRPSQNPTLFAAALSCLCFVLRAYSGRQRSPRHSQEIG